MEKQFKGKAIYNPSGRAGEYSYWACNFYTGCSNNCSYCYLKKGIGAKVLGGCVPKLKKCFKDSDHALNIFVDEINKNINELRIHGLFFTFTSDPFLSETHMLTAYALRYCVYNNIPVKVLSKNNPFKYYNHICSPDSVKYVAFGFTLTGHDELEQGANTNAEL